MKKAGKTTRFPAYCMPFLLFIYLLCTGPPEKTTLSNVLFKLLLVKLVMTVPGCSSSSSPAVTFMVGTATQVCLPSFSSLI